MAKFQATSKAAEAPDIEAAVYDGVLVKVESKRVKGGQYTKDPIKGDEKLEWTFELLDDDGARIREDRDDNPNFGKPVEVSKLTGIGFNTKSKTTPAEILMLKALLTADEFTAFEAGEGSPDSDEQVEDGGMLGRKAQVEVFVKENGWPGIDKVIATRKRRSSK